MVKWLPIFILVAFIASLALLAKTRNTVLEDPNDPRGKGVMQPEVLRRNLKAANEAAYARYARGEINSRQYRRLIAQYADQLASQANLQYMEPSQAWEYADLFRSAHEWGKAADVYKIAVDHAKNDDRKANDNLGYAVCLARLGKLDEAFAAVRTAFTVNPADKAGILPSVLLELAPAVRGRGKDVELAKLIEEAIGQEEQTFIDPKLESGKAFLMAKPHHIRKAWLTIIALYLSAGKPDEAKAAETRMKADPGIGAAA